MTALPWTCPFCGKASFNPRDAREQYCGDCHVFVEDLYNSSPSVRRTMGGLLRKLADMQPENAAPLLRAAELWESLHP